MKKHILVNNKKEIFERSQHIQIEFKLKGEYAWKWLDFFQACEYDENTNILGVNYVAYGIVKTRQWLNCPAVPYIEAFTDKENLEIQQDLQKRLCVSEMKRLIRAKQEIRFHNTEYGIEGAGKNIREAIETFIDNAVKSFVEDDIDPRGVKEEDRKISFYNVEDCEVYLPKKYVDKIWDEIECTVIDKINRRNEDDEDSVINFFYKNQDEATE
jgi:hypothetical protein